MDNNEVIAVTAPPTAATPYVDWPAILGGAVVAAAIAGLFTTFGAALGFSTISAEAGEGSFDWWLIVTGIWVVISLVVSYLAGGYVAGRMRRRHADATADEVSARDAINGLIVWALGMLVTAWLAAGAIGGVASAVGSAAETVGSAVGGAAQGLGAAAGGAAQGAAQAATGSDDGTLDYINDTLMRPALRGVQQSDGVSSPTAPAANDADLARQTGVVLGNVLRTGEISDEDRQFLISAVAQRSGQSESAVEARVDEAIATVQKTRADLEKSVEDAKQAAIDAAETARISAILTAFVLTSAALVAAAAAVIGAVRGGRHRDEGRFFRGFAYRP